jgi:hypothetical protein
MENTASLTPSLSLADAAKACGVTKPTIRARKDKLVELGAMVSKSGWQIPVTALISVGLMEPATPPPEEPARSPLEQEREKRHELEVRNAVLVSENKQLNERIDDLHERIESLEAALAREQSRGLFGWLRHRGMEHPKEITREREDSL